MRSLLRQLRRAGLHPLHRTGVLMRLADHRLRNRCTVLTYHRVLPAGRQEDSFSSPSIMVTPETFERHLLLLKERFHPLTPDEFIRCQGGHAAWPRRACLVTFDDGWRDNLEFAQPLLKKHGIHALLFIAGDFIGTRATFWQEELGRRLYSAWTHRALPPAALAAANVGDDCYAMPNESGKDLVREIILQVKSRRATMLPRLQAQLEPSGSSKDFGEDHFLDWDEVRYMQREGSFTIGSHAMSHVPLTELSAAQVADEFARSRRLLKDELGKEPSTVAYPNGNCNDQVAELARLAGFAVAFTTQRGSVSTGEDAWRLRRINISDSATPDESTLVGRIAGLI